MVQEAILQLAPPTFHGRRSEIQRIIQVATKPLPQNQSQVLLVEGPGGIGKSMLIQHAAFELRQNHPKIACIGPLDLDDTDYRLAVNMGLAVARQLGNEHFPEYLRSLRKYQGKQLERLDSSSILIHMALGDYVFVREYQEYAQHRRIAIFADTVEAIYGTHIWSYFMRMIASLPNTLFVLAGRPHGQFGNRTRRLSEEANRFARMPNIEDENVHLMNLSGWSKQEAQEFVRQTIGANKLSKDDLLKLLHLSRCQPLHITLAIETIRRMSVFEEEDIIEKTPLHKAINGNDNESYDAKPPDISFEELPERGKELVSQFERELLLHLSDTRPLSRVMRRMAHLRRRLNREMYARMIAFSPPIQEAPDWETITKQPWVRHRADDYITLHDIVGELLREHIWSRRDSAGERRKALSKQTVTLYEVLIREQKAEVEELEANYTQRLNEYNTLTNEGESAREFARVTELYQQVLDLNRVMWATQAEQLFYMLDADVMSGYKAFVAAFDKSGKQGQIFAREMFLIEMETFVPAFNVGSDEYYEIAIRQVDAAIDDNLLAKAQEIVVILWQAYDQPQHKYQILKRQGNIYLRIPGHAEEGLQAFEAAAEVQGIAKDTKGEILREIGWANRQLGRWKTAAAAYQKALDDTSLNNQALRALVNKNLAYVEALVGEHDAAETFIASALEYFRSQDDQIALGSSLSIQGEVYRYQKKFTEAYRAYDEAQAIFTNVVDSGWLGLVQQEKAICLVQDNPQAHLEDARRYIENALYLCREYRIRDYAAALNRAGRIHVLRKDYTQAFKSFEEGIEMAEAAQDNWFLMANCAEHAELAFNRWYETKDPNYQSKLMQHKELIEAREETGEFAFGDLFGRWHLVRGHAAWFRGIQYHDRGELENATQQWQEALDEYAVGFPMIALGYYGSHGIQAVPREGDLLNKHIMQLPTAEGKRWCEELNQQWKAQKVPPILSAIVGKIYANVLKQSQEVE